MVRDKISMRQVLSLVSAALLSPMILLLPGTTAAAGGRAGWLSGLAVLPAAWLLGMAFRGIFQALPEEGSLADGLELAYGRWAGRMLTLLYLVWGVVLLGWNARWAAFRFLSTSYRNAPLDLFLFLLIGGALWMGRRKLSVFLRAVEIFALALGLTLGISLLLGLFRMEWENLGPIWVEDLPGAALGALPVLALLGYGVFAGFLGGHIARRPENGRQLSRWTWWACGTLALFQAVCIGAFGPALVRRMEIPYFMLVKDIGVPGAFERGESLVMALWVLADLSLLGMLLFACRNIVEHMQGGKPIRWAPWGIAIAAAGVGFGTVGDGFRLSWIMEHIVGAGNLFLGVGIPLLTGGVLWRKGRKGQRKEK